MISRQKHLFAGIADLSSNAGVSSWLACFQPSGSHESACTLQARNVSPEEFPTFAVPQ